jgi:hypothetical protein
MDDDDALLLHSVASQYQLELDEEEFLDRARFLTAIVIVGSNVDHSWLVVNRHPRRQFLG